MNEQVGWRGLVERLRAEAPRYSQLLPQFPRLAHQALLRAAQPMNDNTELLKALIEEQRRLQRLIGVIVYFGGGLPAKQFLLGWERRIAHGDLFGAGDGRSAAR